MPSAPPNHSTRKTTAVKHRRNHEARGSARERGYTVRWEKFRDQFRREHPLCGYCLNREGRVEPGVVLDHIIPHRGDMALFWPDGPPERHFMHCCVACHAVKQKVEWISDRFGRDLRPLMVRRGMLNEKTGDPLDFPAGEVIDLPTGSMLIYGPPASGKTTLARTMHGVVYDLDDYAVALGLPRYGRSVDEAKQAAAARNRAVVAHVGPLPAIIVASCAKPWEARRWHQATGCDVRLVEVDEATCMARVWADPDRIAALPSQMRAIRQWFRSQRPA